MPNMYKSMGSIHKPGIVVHACDSSTWRGRRIILSYIEASEPAWAMRSYLKTKKTNINNKTS